MNYKLTNSLDRSSSYWKHVKVFEHKNTDNQKLYLITSSVHGYEVLVEMRSLDKTKFYVVGAGIFTELTVALYPISVVKTRMQVATKELVEKSAYDVIRWLIKTEGVPGLYRGFGTVITGAVPARIIFLTALETTKVAAFKMVEPFKLSDPTKAAIANGLAGMTASLFSQGVFVPIDVSQAVYTNPVEQEFLAMEEKRRLVKDEASIMKVQPLEAQEIMAQQSGITTLDHSEMPVNALGRHNSLIGGGRRESGGNLSNQVIENTATSNKDVRFRRTSSYSDVDVSETASFSEIHKSNAKKATPFPDAATALESADGQGGKTVKKKGEEGRQIDPALLGF